MLRRAARAAVAFAPGHGRVANFGWPVIRSSGGIPSVSPRHVWTTASVLDKNRGEVDDNGAAARREAVRPARLSPAPTRRASDGCCLFLPSIPSAQSSRRIRASAIFHFRFRRRRRRRRVSARGAAPYFRTSTSRRTTTRSSLDGRTRCSSSLSSRYSDTPGTLRGTTRRERARGRRGRGRRGRVSRGERSSLECSATMTGETSRGRTRQTRSMA
jgi:hypothetical protein